MDQTTSWLETTRSVITAFFQDVLAYSPFFLGAIGVLVAGWLAARFIRIAARRIATNANRLLDRVFRSGLLAGVRVSTPAATILGEVAFWVVMFLTVTVSARMAGLESVADWLNQLVIYLPSFLTGAAIILLGHFLGAFIGDQVEASARAAKAGQSALLGRLAQGGVFVSALIIGLGQIGVDVTFIVAVLAVAVGAVLVGFSIAFGLGSRDFVGNLIGARSAQRQLMAGMRIRIGDIVGEVLEITPTHIAVDTAEGRMLVPAQTAHEQPITILTGDAPGARDA